MLAIDQECAESLSLLNQIIETIENTSEQERQFRDPLCSLHNDIFGQCRDDLSSILDFTELENGQDIMGFLTDTDCDVTMEATECGRQLSAALKNK